MTEETWNEPESNESEMSDKLQQIPLRRRKPKKTDPVVIGLMYGVSFLCLCITGVMLYWLIAFFS